MVPLLTLFAVLPSALAEESPQQTLYFPTAEPWQTVPRKEAGLDKTAVRRALDFAMRRQSSGVIILHQGRLLAERHQQLADASRRYQLTVRGTDDQGHVVEDVASCQKSVTSVLVGIAQQKGLLRINDPVSNYLGTGWSKATADQESKITVRHLLTMTSGLTEQRTFEAPAGSEWRYNSAVYSRALTVVCRAADGTANELTKKWLTGPLGMHHSRWVERNFAGRTGVDANRLGFATTARDLARFGLLMLAGGQWRNQTILSDRDYLKASISTSQKRNPAYGYLWWLNGTAQVKRGRRLLAGPLIPGAPDDLYAAQGALGRRCYVVPSRRLVVVRLGDSPDKAGQKRFDVEFWRLLLSSATH